MSHIAEYQCSLNKVDPELLKKAMEMVAKNRDGKVTATVDSVDERDNVAEWHGKKIFGAIRTKDLPQGVGIILDKNGKPTYAYDKLYVAEKTTNFVRNSTFHKLAKQSEDEMHAIQAAVERTYKTLAIGVALKKMGCDVSVQSSDRATIITGEKI